MTTRQLLDHLMKMVAPSNSSVPVWVRAVGANKAFENMELVSLRTVKNQDGREWIEFIVVPDEP
jgi:hypothetical protein